MTEDPTASAPRPVARESAVGDHFAERWRRLDPDEQALVVMALDAIRAGEFDPIRIWDRFVDATIELLPLLSDGTITLDDLRELALEHSCSPKRDAGT
jgi:hypothetical protein